MPTPCESWPSRFAVTRLSATSRASAGALPPAATIASIARLSESGLKCMSIGGRQFRLGTMRTLSALLAWLVLCAGKAQTYPAKPVRVVVPYAAGGTSDTPPRQLGPKVSEAWGDPVEVENNAGANGNDGPAFLAKNAAVV